MQSQTLPRFLVDTIANKATDTIRVVGIPNETVYFRETYAIGPSTSAARQDSYRRAHRIAEHLETLSTDVLPRGF